MRVPDWAPVLTDTATPSALVLRGHRPEDVDAVLDQCRDPEFERWTGIPWPYRRSHAEEFVRTREGEWTAGRYLGLAVELDGRFAGTVDLRPDGAGSAELGYGLASWARGRGIAGRALRLLLPWAFEALELDVVTWSARAGNWASRRVAWAVGFQVSGQTPALLAHRGRRVDGWTGRLQRGSPLVAAHPWFDLPTLPGGAVVLRPHRDEDAEAMAVACSDPLTQHWLPLLPSPYTVTRAQEHLFQIADDRAAGRALHWAVSASGPEPGGATLLGEIGLQVDVRDGTAEVGYWAHPQGRGRGLTTAAVRLAARHALLPVEDGGLGLRRVLLRAAAGNTASQRVALAAGFTRSGVDRDGERLRDGTVQDMIRFDLLAAECP